MKLLFVIHIHTVVKMTNLFFFGRKASISEKQFVLSFMESSISAMASRSSGLNFDDGCFSLHLIMEKHCELLITQHNPVFNSTVSDYLSFILATDAHLNTFSAHGQYEQEGSKYNLFHCSYGPQL